MNLLNKLSLATTSYDNFRSNNKKIESFIYYTLVIILSLICLTYLDFSFVEKSFEPIAIFTNLILMVIPVIIVFVLVYVLPNCIKKSMQIWQEKIINKKVELCKNNNDYSFINDILNGAYNYIHLNFVAKAIFSKKDGSWLNIEKIELPKEWNSKETIFKNYKDLFNEDPNIDLYDSSERYYILSKICPNTFSDFEKELNKSFNENK